MKKHYIVPTLEQTEVTLRTGICSVVGKEEVPGTVNEGEYSAPARKLYV